MQGKGSRGEIPRAEFPEARSLGIRHLARELITEYGDLAGAVALQKSEGSSTEDEARQWRQVLEAVSSLHPGPQR